MMTQNLHPKVKWKLKYCISLLSRAISSTHEEVSSQLFEDLHWSSDEEGSTRKPVFMWKDDYG